MLAADRFLSGPALPSGALSSFPADFARPALDRFVRLCILSTRTALEDTGSFDTVSRGYRRASR